MVSSSGLQPLPLAAYHSRSALFLSEPLSNEALPMNKPARGSLLGIEHLHTKEILGLLKLARRMNPEKAPPMLRGKRVVLRVRREIPQRDDHAGAVFRIEH